jgi:hypothetical protein
MIASETTTSPSTSNTVLAGLLTRRELAGQLRCGERTIIRRERQGMPLIAVGMMRLYEPEKVRAWLIAHERQHNTPRRGRPRKAA